MLLNENRGSFGMFSRAGRNSAEKYNILVRKDEILGGLKKKVLKDIFTPDEVNKNYESGDDDIDIFKVDKTDKKDIKIGDRSNNKVNPKQKPKSEIAKYLEMRKKVRNKSENPACTKYNPKNEFVWKRTITGANWDRTIGKNQSRIQKEERDLPFYNSHTEFKVEGKNFVDLARQTRRASFGSTGGIKVKNYKSIDSKSEFQSTNTNYNTGKYKTSYSFYARDKSSPSNNLNTYSSGDESGSFDSLSKKKTKGPFSKTFMNTTSNGNRWVKLQAPDFKKIISREQLDKIYGDKRTIIPFSFPNSKWTRPRPIMMVKYDQTLHKRNKYDRPQNSDCLELNINYDPHKVLDKVNNHKKSNAPNFDLMTSRPNQPDSLPCYLKNIHSRQSAEMMTEKALKMNNFAEGKFSTAFTSFWPKKSYNKIINLNLLNSAKFKENVGFKTEEDGKSGELNDYIQKSMKFYNKNYDDLIKESMLNRFDNVTFKTIKRENKFETGDLEKFLINFEKVDA